MNEILVTACSLFTLWSLPHGHLWHEPVFGLDIPAYGWTEQSDKAFFGAPQRGELAIPTDAANLRFAASGDTTDIILITDKMTGQIRWLRCCATCYPRPIQYVGYYGKHGSGIGRLEDPTSIAVASTTPYYDQSRDRIYVADRMSGKIVKLNFSFDELSPENDRIVFESEVKLDQEFFPEAIKYINFYSSDRSDNRLIALDDIGRRLVIFSDDGLFLSQYYLPYFGDSLGAIYEAITYRIGERGSIFIYMADYTYSAISCFQLNKQGYLSFIGKIHLGDINNTAVTDVEYSPSVGLLAIEREGPHIYKIDEFLTRIEQEMGTAGSDISKLYRPQKIVIFPDRLAVFESFGDTTGIMTFAFSKPSRRECPAGLDSLACYVAPAVSGRFNQEMGFLITFGMRAQGRASLEIFDVAGRKLATLVRNRRKAGSYVIRWNGRNRHHMRLPSGIYFVRLTTPWNSQVKKLIISE